jgi:tetratricopeptide (TPR) repeat protein
VSTGKRRSFIEVLFHGDPFERFVVAIITSAAVLAATVTLLQTNASALSSQAGRDAQRYAIQAMGRRITGYVTVDYAWHAYQVYEELDTQALMAERADDDAAALRYWALRSRLAELSPFLAPPYYEPDGGVQPKLAYYEADTYLVAATGLAERYAAAAALNNAWTARSNAYVTHLTLLAVSLFLFGLATTVPGWIRYLFVVVGLFITAMVVVWIGWVTLRPLPTLTERAIDAYAQGVGLAHRRDHEAAITAYDEALAASPGYANAYYERANTRYDLADYEGAVADYRAAQAAGRDDVNVAWNLGWTYYLLGRFDDSIAASNHAVQQGPDQVGARFNVALAYLAAGQFERARIEYTDAMDVATRQVARVTEGGDKPPSSLWTYMDAAVRDLEGLIDQLRGEPRAWSEAPAPDMVSEPEAVIAAAEDIARQIKSLTVALEYTGRPPGVSVTARVTPLEFAKPTYDDAGNLLGRTIATAFPYGTDRVLAIFDYAGMQDGQEVLWKLYHNGWEDPSWRLIETWSLGRSGSAEKPFSLSYTNLYQFTPGEYKIELYVDNQWVQQGIFEIDLQE